MISTRRFVIVAASLAAALSAVLLLGVLAGSRTAAGPPTASIQEAAAPDGSLPRPRPRVVIALAPGETPPPAQSPDPAAMAPATPVPATKGHGPASMTAKYADGSDPSSFRPPSDAQVRLELHQLRVLGVGGSGAYVNPFAHVSGLVPERIDMGVDYAGTGPVVALGSGMVFNTSGPGWPGGNFIGIVLDSGPYRGRPYFIAEDVKPTVRVGQHVQAGQVIGVMYNGGSGTESGWASGRGDEPLAAALHQQAASDPGGWSSSAGISFDRLLVSAGAPSGIPQGGGSHGTMPPGYP